jgi:outer membrane protein OmpA-like peptidoglycan-associated protein
MKERKTKKRPSSIATVAIVALASLSLAGCSLGERALDCNTLVGEPSLNVEREVAVVLAPTSNFLDFNNVLVESGPKIADLLSQDGTALTVVLADSNPSIVTKYSVDFSGALLDVDRDQIVQIAQGRLGWAVECASQEAGLGFEVDEEVDFLRGIQVASESFSPTSSEKYIFVLGNGIQTSGQFSLVDGIPSDSSSSEKLVEKLASEGALGSFGGATVFWEGLAQVNNAQPALNKQSIDSIVLLWNKIILAAGGRIGAVSAGNITDGVPASGAIRVSSVTGLKDACVSITIGGDRGFSFNGDSATFIDSEKALAGAQEVATEIKSTTCTGSVTVTGFTASGVDRDSYTSAEEEINKTLSLQRAEAFASLLRQAGVSVEIIVKGAGKGPVNDWDANGKFVDEAGAQNRIVIVTQN